MKIDLWEHELDLICEALQMAAARHQSMAKVSSGNAAAAHESKVERMTLLLKQLEIITNVKAVQPDEL